MGWNLVVPYPKWSSSPVSGHYWYDAFPVSRAGSRWLVRKYFFGTFCPELLVRKLLAGSTAGLAIPSHPCRLWWVGLLSQKGSHPLLTMDIFRLHAFLGWSCHFWRWDFALYAPEPQSHDPPVHFVLLNRKYLPGAPCPEIFARNALSGKPCPEKLVPG